MEENAAIDENKEVSFSFISPTYNLNCVLKVLRNLIYINLISVVSSLTKDIISLHLP